MYKINKHMVLDRSPAAVNIEGKIDWILVWEMALDCGESCVRKIK